MVKDKSTASDGALAQAKPAAKTNGAAKPAAPKVTAKAGKRSSKALAEAAEQEAKQQRKLSAKKGPEGIEVKPKTAAKPPRTKLERAGKKLREAARKIDRTKLYNPVDALALATQTSPTNFDATVELHLNLRVDPKQADQNIRGSVNLPAGTGKTLRIAVLADAQEALKAQKAGAEITGGDDLLQQLDRGRLDFDLLIATPAMMPKLSKYARLLGPKGLMPNPKSGTVAADTARAVSEAKAGKIEYRVDANGIVHAAIGKVSFGAERLGQNLDAVMASVRAAKPPAIKGGYIQSAYLATTMGPSIRLEV